MRNELHNENEIVSLLATIPLFASLEESDRRMALRAADVLTFGPGEVIVREGSEAREFFVLLSGEATVAVAGHENDEPIEVGVAHAGEIIGELGALLGIA